jgi:hypothetical protein
MTAAAAIILTTTDGYATVSPRQASALAAEGLVIGVPEPTTAVPGWDQPFTVRTDLDNAGVLAWLVAHPELGRCDFCAADDYPCAEHTMISGDLSTGSWRACQACATLIDEDRRDELADRGKHNSLEATRAIHDGFWAHRQGPGHPVEPC